MRRQIERFHNTERQLWESVRVEPVERYVRLQTGESVRLQESGDGPPVLLIHGATNGGTSWMSLMAQLSGFRCIALDRPGCGLSEPLVNAPLRNVGEVEVYADRLIADVLDALDLPSAHILATSYGGYFALRGAAARPDRVDRVILYSWPMGAPMERVPFAMRMGAVPGMQRLTTALPVTPSAAKALLRQIGLKRAINNGRFSNYMLDWFVSLLRDTETLTNELRSSPSVVTPIRGLNRQLLHTDELLADVTAPTLFLWGDEDPNGGVAVAREFAARLPNSTLEVIPQAGHAPWIDELDRCAAQTRSFLLA